MTQITSIGAGSAVFTRDLTRDILTFPRLEDATLCLIGIDAERLDFAQRAVQPTVDRDHYPATVQATQNRVEACLTGNPRLVFQAIANDPLTEIEQVVNQMFEQNCDYLPQFEKFRV